MDSNLLSSNLWGSLAGFNPKQYKEYFRQGLRYTFRDTLGAKLYHYWYRLQDTLEYALNFAGPLVGMESANLNSGNFLLSLKPREDRVMDWLRFLPDGTIDLHRFEPTGQHFHHNFTLKDYPRYGVSCMWSMPDGSFYLGGRAEKTLAKGMALLIYIDSLGNSKTLPGHNIFNLHYDHERESLKVFYDEDQGELDYQIWDMTGKPRQSGFFDVMEGISLEPATPRYLLFTAVDKEWGVPG